MTMFHHGQRRTIGSGSSLTQLGKTMLIVYVTVYIFELIVEPWLGIPVYNWLALNPLNSGAFQLWQLLSHPFVHNPAAPISFLIDCVIFFFFAGTIESALGTRHFLNLYIISAIGGMVAGLIFGVMGPFGITCSGMMPSLLALIVVFGLLQPEATILLMFVIPIKAKYISYGTIIVTALTFLAQTNAHGAYHLGGIAFGWIYFRAPTQWLDLNWWRWKHFEHTQKKRRSKFTVIKGNSDDKKDNKDTPTLH